MREKSSGADALPPLISRSNSVTSPAGTSVGCESSAIAREFARRQWLRILAAPTLCGQKSVAVATVTVPATLNPYLAWMRHKLAVAPGCSEVIAWLTHESATFPIRATLSVAGDRPRTILRDESCRSYPRRFPACQDRLQQYSNPLNDRPSSANRICRASFPGKD